MTPRLPGGTLSLTGKLPKEVTVSPTRAQIEGSFVTPAFEHARVSDAMRAGVISCPQSTPVRTVAQMMAGNHVHSIVVTGADAAATGRPWGIVSDVDLARVAADADDLTAAEVCATEVISVVPDETLARAAQLMAEHETGHLIVVDPGTQEPIGVVSTLDLAGVVAWGRA
jgi:CBS domain-containing protein